MRSLAIVVFAIGCGPDDPAQVGEDSSSGEPGPSTGMTIDPTASGPTAADSSGSSGGASESSSDDGSTGAVAMGSARLLVRERVDTVDDPVMREYADGVLSEALAIEPELPAGSGVSSLMVAPGGDFVTYCVSAPPELGVDCYVRTLAAGSVGAAQAFSGGDLPDPLAPSIPQWVDPPGAYLFRAWQHGGTGTDVIMRVGYDDDVLGVPEALVVPPPGFGASVRAVSADGAWLAYESGSTDVPANIFVVPTDAIAPAVPVAASALTDPSLRARDALFLHDSNALIYEVTSAMVGIYSQAYYLVDLAGPAPSGARIDDPADDALDVSLLSLAPDDHALVYWVGGPELGELMFVALDGVSPQPPALASTLGATDVRRADIGWSPDSRWAYYTAQHDSTGTFDLYLVAAAADTPSSPIAATSMVEGGSLGHVGFDAASRWMYVVAPLESHAAELFRIDVSGDEPGAPQRVSGTAPGSFRIGGVVPSQDGSMMLYTLDHGVSVPRELWVVDVAGDEPGTPIRVDVPEAGLQVLNGAMSPNNSVVSYSLVPLEPDANAPRPQRLVDLSAPHARIELSDDAASVTFLPD